MIDPTDALVTVVAGLEVLQLGWFFSFQRRLTHVEDLLKEGR